MSNEVCNDNRFEIIEAAKQELIRCTNIEMCPDEMSVIDSVLFRLWQMGWLPGQERTCTLTYEYSGVPILHSITVKGLSCGHEFKCYGADTIPNYCPECRAKVVEE